MQLTEWLTAHPNAVAEKYSGGIYLYLNGEDGSDLSSLNGFKIAARNAVSAFLRPAPNKMAAQEAAPLLPACPTTEAKASNLLLPDPDYPAAAAAVRRVLERAVMRSGKLAEAVTATAVQDMTLTLIAMSRT